MRAAAWLSVLVACGTPEPDPCEGVPDGECDADGDGFAAEEDCDDRAAVRNAGLPEDCDDGEDNDCDLRTDRADPDCKPGGPAVEDSGWIVGASAGFHGSMAQRGDGVEVIYGFGVTTGNGSWGCSINAVHAGGDPAPPGCPDCTFAYGTHYAGGGTVGDHCEDLVRPGVFAEEDVSTVWWGAAGQDELLGWGFAETYLYFYAGHAYAMENVIFLYHTAYGWVPRHYDIPALGVDQVQQDSDPMVFMDTGATYYAFAY